MSVWNSNFEATPAGSETPSLGDNRIREVKEAVRERVIKEHVMNLSSGAASEDGYHRAGSSKIYIQEAEPTTRPDGVALSAADDGRMWYKPSTKEVSYYDHSEGGWQTQLAGSSQFVAAEAISANEVIALTDLGLAQLADKTDPDKVNVVGVAVNSAAPAETVVAAKSGTLPGFSGVETNALYFLGEAGALQKGTGDFTVSEYRRFVGFGLNSTTLDLNVQAVDHYSEAQNDRNIGDVFYSANAALGRLQGVLPFGSGPVVQADFPELYSVVGDSFEAAWVDLGYDTSGALSFYPTPPPGVFPRAAIPKTEISTAEVDTANDRIDDPDGNTFAFHILKDGTPVILSTDDTAPGGITAGTTYYARLVNTNQSIELYDTELNAINTSGTTGRVDITSTGTGPHYIHNAGVKLNTAMWPHRHLLASSTYPTGSHKTGGSGEAAGFDLTTTQSTGTWQTAIGTNRYYEDAEANTGTPNLSNETRPDTILLYAYIKASHITPTGEAVSALRYSTGWVANSDWTDAGFTVAHNLDEDLSNLIVKFFVSTDGTEANAFEITMASRTAVSATSSNSDEGVTIYQTDSNSFKIQTGLQGIALVQDSGGLTLLNTESWYYKVVVYKPNILANYTGSRNTVISITDATDQTVAIPSASSIDYPIFIKRVGAGAGVVNLSFQAGEDETDVASLEGDGGYIELIASGGKWYIRDYLDHGDDGSGNYWEKRADGTMEQWGHESTTTDTSVANLFGSSAGTVYYDSYAVTFPKEFTTLISIVAVETAGGNVCAVSARTTTGFNLTLYSNANSDAVHGDWHAIGRWK